MATPPPSPTSLDPAQVLMQYVQALKAKGMTGPQIKSILTRWKATLAATTARTSAQASGAARQRQGSESTILNYILNIAKQMKAASSNKTQLMQLAREVVNFLADRKVTANMPDAEWQKIAQYVEKNLGPIIPAGPFKDAVINSVKMGNHMTGSRQAPKKPGMKENFMNESTWWVANTLLEACGLCWLDLGMHVLPIMEGCMILENVNYVDHHQLGLSDKSEIIMSRSRHRNLSESLSRAGSNWNTVGYRVSEVGNNYKIQKRML